MKTITVDPDWAFVKIDPLEFCGRIGFLLDRLADFRFFLSILPFTKAVDIFFSDSVKSVDELAHLGEQKMQ